MRPKATSVCGLKLVVYAGLQDLDLDDAKSYRDLSRPIGAQDEQQRHRLADRYAT